MRFEALVWLVSWVPPRLRGPAFIWSPDSVTFDATQAVEFLDARRLIRVQSFSRKPAFESLAQAATVSEQASKKLNLSRNRPKMRILSASQMRRVDELS